MKLYAHPFSSYCQKVLIALYENATPFELCLLAVGDEQVAAEHGIPPFPTVAPSASGDRIVAGVRLRAAATK